MRHALYTRYTSITVYLASTNNIVRYRTSTKHGFSVSEFLALFGIFFGAVGASSTSNVVQHFVLPRYTVGARRECVTDAVKTNAGAAAEECSAMFRGGGDAVRSPVCCAHGAVSAAHVGRRQQRLIACATSAVHECPAFHLSFCTDSLLPAHRVRSFHCLLFTCVCRVDILVMHSQVRWILVNAVRVFRELSLSSVYNPQQYTQETILYRCST